MENLSVENEAKVPAVFLQIIIFITGEVNLLPRFFFSYFLLLLLAAAAAVAKKCIKH